ncbi:hypothetical protein EDD21DRAFT_385389 [Dissophora ornata]|nr:hypothetical protein BGZ58_000727 [Dissophora ornata]KAI8597462.1 hypothetical protein EDD21DRAFT_385389 [Dissophora ornata]
MQVKLTGLGIYRCLLVLLTFISIIVILIYFPKYGESSCLGCFHWTDWASITINVILFIAYICSLKSPTPFYTVNVRAFLMLLASTILFASAAKTIQTELKYQTPKYPAFQCIQVNNNYLCILGNALTFLAIATGALGIFEALWTWRLDRAQQHTGGAGNEKNDDSVADAVSPNQYQPQPGMVATQPLYYPQPQQQQQQQQPAFGSPAPVGHKFDGAGYPIDPLLAQQQQPQMYHQYQQQQAYSAAGSQPSPSFSV